MKPNYAASMVAAVAVALGSWGLITPAKAAPPTVTPSPGYDARLQEQRAAQSAVAPPYQGVVRRPTPPRRHHVKRLHHGAH